MKYCHVLIFIFILVGCRTSRDLHRTVDSDIIEDKEYSSIERIRDSIETVIRQRMSVEMGERIYIREYYPPIPGDSISRIKSETTIERENKQQTDTDLRQTGIKDTEKNSDSTSTTITNVREKEDIKSDSRLIQGAEWLWTTLAVITLAVIIFLYIKRKIPP